MTRARVIAMVVTLVLLGTSGCGQHADANKILEKVVANYDSMQTYKSEGTISSEIDTGQTKMSTVTSFSILLKKPNLYVISWTQKNVPLPGMTQSGAVWSDGTQPYLYMGVLNGYSKIAGDEIALAGATGISGGAAFTIPSLFFSALKELPPPLSRLKDPKIEGTDKVAGEECYVIAAASAMSKREVFWVSKSRHLILKYSRSLEPPEEGMVVPEMTDEQLEESIKAMGQEVTEASKKRAREMMEKSRTMLKTTKIKGTLTELHADVSSPELDKTDFTYALPEGTVLKQSLFDGVMGENGEIPENSMSPDEQ